MDLTSIFQNIMWSNFHTHSNYCDGKTSLMELLEEAQRLSMKCLGLSSHAPLPFEKAWAMKQDDLHQYLKEVQELKKISNTVEVYAGLEIDYVPGKISPKDFASQLDYTIGSIHFVDQYKDGTPWEIDNTNAVFMDGLTNIFDGNVQKAITRYFELTREMLQSDTPHVLGHMDKIKMQNAGNKLFREDDKWYRDQVTDTIDVIKRTGPIVEVNTRGIYQKKSETTYPSPWIIELLFKNDIPITISSDAHHPKDLTNCFSETAGMLNRIGYEEIYILRGGSWKATPIQ
jgi:histidinol-phosphatase (PHP family)